MKAVKINKQKAQKKCVIKKKIKFENYKNCLGATQLDNKIKYRGKNIHGIEKIIKNRK